MRVCTSTHVLATDERLLQETGVQHPRRARAVGWAARGGGCRSTGAGGAPVPAEQMGGDLCHVFSVTLHMSVFTDLVSKVIIVLVNQGTRRNISSSNPTSLFFFIKFLIDE